MSQLFNASEIVEIAVDIEKNGAAFYRKAAEFIKEEEVKSLFLDLASWEDEHADTYSRILISLGEENLYNELDPEGDASKYLQAIAEGKVFDLSRPPAALLSGNESTQEVLRIAMSAEKDSVVFYLGMAEMLKSEQLGEINRIIKEEMKHIRFVGELQKKYS